MTSLWHLIAKPKQKGACQNWQCPGKWNWIRWDRCWHTRKRKIQATGGHVCVCACVRACVCVCVCVVICPIYSDLKTVYCLPTSCSHHMKLSTMNICLNIQQMGSGSVCHTTLLFILAAGGWVWVWVWIWIRQTGVSFSTAPSCACVCVNLSLCTLSALCTCLLRGTSLPFFLKECFNRSLKPYQRTETLNSYSSRTESRQRVTACISTAHRWLVIEIH